MNHYEILAEASGGKLTATEVKNLEKYGAKHPMEFAPEPEPKDGECACGEVNCPDAYAHTTSGY